MFKMSKKYHNKTSLEITTNCKLPTPLTLPPLQGNHYDVHFGYLSYGKNILKSY